MKNRKAFNFYRSYYDLVLELPDEQKVQFLMAILNKQFLDVEPELHGLVGLLYKSQKHSIDAQVNGYKNKKGIITPSVLPTQVPYHTPSVVPSYIPSVQGEEKGEEKEKEQVEGEGYKKYKFIKYNKLTDEYDFEYKTKKQKEELSTSELLEYDNEENVFIKNYKNK